jgi:hypothetical protein
MTETKKKIKSICQMVFKREHGNQLLVIKVSKEVEALFKNKLIETSENYKDSKGNGLKFYKLSDKLSEFTDLFNRQNGNYTRTTATIQKYGTSLYLETGELNVSILRSVGISQGLTVAVKGLIVDTDVQRWLQDFAKYVKFLYVSFVDKSEVKASINLEF